MRSGFNHFIFIQFFFKRKCMISFTEFQHSLAHSERIRASLCLNKQKSLKKENYLIKNSKIFDQIKQTKN